MSARRARASAVLSSAELATTDPQTRTVAVRASGQFICVPHGSIALPRPGNRQRRTMVPIGRSVDRRAKSLSGAPSGLRMAAVEQTTEEKGRAGNERKASCSHRLVLDEQTLVGLVFGDSWPHAGRLENHHAGDPGLQ